jgi:hypothetical protein
MSSLFARLSIKASLTAVFLTVPQYLFQRHVFVTVEEYGKFRLSVPVAVQLYDPGEFKTIALGYEVVADPAVGLPECRIEVSVLSVI